MKNKKINWLKSSFLFGMIGLFSAGIFSCEFLKFDFDPEDAVETFQVQVKLIYPEGFDPLENVTVKLENTMTRVFYEAEADEHNVATFNVISGVYRASVVKSFIGEENAFFVYNGIISGQVVGATGLISETGTIDLNLIASKTSQVIIKELYFGGCQQNVSGVFQRDQYIILYNNSTEMASLENVCVGMNHLQSTQANNDIVDGKLFYEAEGWIPAAWGFWTFRNTITLAPGEEIVIAVSNAIDHTETHTRSINFNNPAYYAMYDIESGFANATYYPAPAVDIPSSNYMKGFRYAASNAWIFPVTSPAGFIFATPEGTTPQEFEADPKNENMYGTQGRRKVPMEWVLDAVEIFQYGAANNQKRFPAAVDGGYIEIRAQYGFSAYRNVDKIATEGIPENEGKIVYDYDMGTEEIEVSGATINGSTDPSGIDAEASIRNGALIIYMDTNNSGIDFHMRREASLRYDYPKKN